VRMGYEVALAEPLQHFYLYRNPLPHDLKLLKRILSWLGKEGILFSGHTLLYWVPILKRLGVVKGPVVSLVYAREELDFARSHTGILALTPAAAEHAKRLAPQAKVAHLGWGVDLNFFPKVPYSPEWFLSCGIANRDFQTLAAAAAKCRHPMRVICPGLPSGLDWPPHVTVIDGGPGWSTDKTKTLTARDLINDYFPHSTATLIIMKNDPTQYTANGFTNLMEAMAVGQPVIVTRTGALPGEIDVEKTGCGLHVPPNDSGALADALELVSNDPALARAMGEKGRKLVEDRYNIDRYARDLHRFFESF
jgi:glycosyltransferase involved in cell wall biosynthesis